MAAFPAALKEMINLVLQGLAGTQRHDLRRCGEAGKEFQHVRQSREFRCPLRIKLAQAKAQDARQAPLAGSQLRGKIVGDLQSKLRRAPLSRRACSLAVRARSSPRP